MLSRIIIIEDEFFVQIHLTKILTNLGYQVVNSYHCTEDFLEETDWNFDIALVDIFLSETLTGIDAAKEIKQKQKPFIFLTANQDSTTILEAAQLGPSAYLTKPFIEADIEAALTILKLKVAPSIFDPFFVFLKNNNYTTTPLTLREIDVLKTILLETKNSITAKKLFISENTLKTHLRNIYKKFIINDKSELINIIREISKKK
jgi:DNA-binding NarL/FixJ family response regulator